MLGMATGSQGGYMHSISTSAGSVYVYIVVSLFLVSQAAALPPLSAITVVSTCVGGQAGTGSGVVWLLHLSVSISNLQWSAILMDWHRINKMTTILE